MLELAYIYQSPEYVDYPTPFLTLIFSPYHSHIPPHFSNGMLLFKQ